MIYFNLCKLCLEVLQSILLAVLYNYKYRNCLCVGILKLLLLILQEKNRAPYRVYTPPYVLARGREKLGGGGGGECSDTLTASSDTPCSVLYVSYCLSEDQHWLLATATDEQGVILEKATVNVHIPNRLVICCCLL